MSEIERSSPEKHSVKNPAQTLKRGLLALSRMGLPGGDSSFEKVVFSRLTTETHFTREEVRKLWRSFVKDFPRGCLNAEQFRRNYALFYPQGDSRDFAEHLFRTFDFNRDGELNFEEFARALSVMQRGTDQDKISWAFRMYDVNNDGVIDLSEIEEITKSLVKLCGDRTGRFCEDGLTAKERADVIFSELCLKQKRERISREEFLETLKIDSESLRIVWDFV